MSGLDTSLGGSQGMFPRTTGGLIARFADPDTPDRQADFEELCRRYWKPVYRYLRIARAKSNEDAKDLTQAFFLWIVEGEPLRRYRAEKSGFRKFLKMLLEGFVNDQDDARRRLKRGGHLKFVDIDAEAAGFGDSISDAQAAEPWRAFDQAWAIELTRHAIARVRARRAAEGRLVPMQIFEAYDLLEPAERPTYAALGKQFGVKETDVQNHLSAVRDDVHAEVKAELTRLTRDDRDLREEWNDLFGG